jgi:hypothetical protein
MKLFTDTSTELIATLIQQWDTPPMYTFDGDLFTSNKGQKSTNSGNGRSLKN